MSAAGPAAVEAGVAAFLAALAEVGDKVTALVGAVASLDATLRRIEARLDQLGGPAPGALDAGGCEGDTVH